MRVTALIMMLFFLGGCAGLPAMQSDSRNQLLRLEAAAMHAYHGDEPEQAEHLYRQMVELDPAWTQAWFRLGNLAAQRGDLDAALDAFDRTLALEPEHHRAQHNRALAQMRQGAESLVRARQKLEAEGADNVYQADRFLAGLLVGLVETVELAIDCEDPVD